MNPVSLSQPSHLFNCLERGQETMSGYWLMLPRPKPPLQLPGARAASCRVCVEGRLSVDSTTGSKSIVHFDRWLVVRSGMSKNAIMPLRGGRPVALARAYPVVDLQVTRGGSSMGPVDGGALCGALGPGRLGMPWMVLAQRTITIQICNENA